MPLPLSRATVFAEGLDHPECVAAHPDGTFYAGGEIGQIYRVSADGKKVEEIASTGGFTLGLAVSPDNKWLAIVDGKHKAVFKYEFASRTLSEFSRGGDEEWVAPNHLAFSRDGYLYVTDCGGFEKKIGRIHRLDLTGRGGVWHRGPFKFCNGIAIGPDGRSIFTCCTWLHGVERIAIEADGSPGKRSVYARVPKSLPDGLCFDARGNLYVTCYAPSRIWKVTPQRKVSILIDDWESHTLSNPTNICFGGKNFDELYAANLGRWQITRIALKTRGLPLASHAQAGD